MNASVGGVGQEKRSQTHEESRGQAEASQATGPPTGGPVPAEARKFMESAGQAGVFGIIRLSIFNLWRVREGDRVGCLVLIFLNWI